MIILGALVALYMVLRQDWESVEVDAQLTKWGRFKLRLRRPDRAGPGPLAAGPAEPPGTAPPAQVTRLARRGRSRTRDPDRHAGAPD